MRKYNQGLQLAPQKPLTSRKFNKQAKNEFNICYLSNLIQSFSLSAVSNKIVGQEFTYCVIDMQTKIF